MKKDKKITKIVEKCLGECCNEGKINLQKTQKALQLLKSLDTKQAIFAISLFLEGLKRHQDQYKLVVESTAKLSKNELESIAKKIKKDFQITTVENIISPNLLGGMKLKIADTVFDYSIKDKINQIKEAIAA